MEMYNLYNIQLVLEEMGQGKDFDTALWEITGYTLEEFEEVWISAHK